MNQDYNQRLDEILADHREWMRGIRTDRLVGTSSEATKQAITSLIKELVAEAKPKEMDSFYEKPIVDEFEQNLLKALEEV